MTILFKKKRDEECNNNECIIMNTFVRQVLTFAQYDTLNYTTPLKILVEGFIFR